MPAKRTTPVFGALDRNKTLVESSVNRGRVVLDTYVTLANPEGTGFQGGSFSVTLTNATPDDDLYIARREGISLQTDPETGVTEVQFDGLRIGTVTSSGQDGAALAVTFDQPVDDAAATALARAITYANADDTPAKAARALVYSATDAEGTTTTAKMQLKVKADPDAPVFSGFERTSTHGYADAMDGFVIDSDMSVSDPDGTNFKGATLNVHVIGATATDQLYLAPGAFTITGTKLYLGSTLVGTVSSTGVSGSDLAFTFKGRTALSDEQVSTLLQQVSYRSTASESPSDPCNVSFTLTDAQKGVGYREVTLEFMSASPVFLPASPEDGITRLSAGSASSYAAVSPDGTKVAFLSSVSGINQVFVRDLKTGALTLVSSSAAGSAGNGANTDTIVFSPDGHKMAFVSSASNLVPGDTNGAEDVFVKDLDTGAVTRVSTDGSGGEANAWSERPVFSPDGSKIAFESAASNFGVVDTDGNSDLFVKDLATGAITRVSTTQAGAGFGGGAYNPSFSPDGTKIAFMAFGTEAGPNVLSSTAVYVKDLTTGEITFVSYASAHEIRPVFSPDGTKVAFLSDPGDVIPGAAHDSTQLFLKDLDTGEVTLVSSDPAGIAGNGLTSGTFSFSPDGSRIVFSSGSSNLVPGDTDGKENIFIKELATGAVTRIAGNSDGASFNPVFTADGAHVVFTSNASGLVAGDTNGVSDIFMASLAVPSATSAALTEDPARSTFTAKGTVYFADPDPLDTHFANVHTFADNLGTLSAEVVSDMNGTGAAVWSYSVDEARLAPLAPGETRTDTFFVTVSDGLNSTRTTVTVTLTGADEGSATPAVATFAFAHEAASSARAETVAPDLWASVAASLSGTGEDLGNFLDVLQAQVPAQGSMHVSGATGLAPFADLGVGSLEQLRPHLATAFNDALDILLDHTSEHEGAAQPREVHDIAESAEAIATRLWEALHAGHDGLYPPI